MVDFGNSTHCRSWFFKGEKAAEEHLKAIGEQKLQTFRTQVRQFFQQQRRQLSQEEID